MRSRVDCGLGLVMLNFCPMMRLRRVDLPTLGFPTTVTIPERGITEITTAGCGLRTAGEAQSERPADGPRMKLNWGGRTRTCNFRINSPAVCQLTYTPRERRDIRS